MFVVHVYPHLNIHNLSTRSYPSDEENRPKIAAKIASVNDPLEKYLYP